MRQSQTKTAETLAATTVHGYEMILILAACLITAFALNPKGFVAMSDAIGRLFH